MMLFRILLTKDLSVLGNICNFAKNNQDLNVNDNDNDNENGLRV